MNGNSGPRLAWVNGQKWQNGNGGKPPTGQKVRPQKAADGERVREMVRGGEVRGGRLEKMLRAGCMTLRRFGQSSGMESVPYSTLAMATPFWLPHQKGAWH